jgi:ABC-type phosphate transport system ATPase subunit
MTYSNERPLPIEIALENRSGANEAGFGLEMRMNDQLRMQAESVSESQRFFLDIALRMALTEMITSGPATLMIDTPEGSLDITYEARAGAMLARFVEGANRLIVTANLRSSELVLRLARLQTRANMQLARMTEWTDLSEVQQAEETLFTNAYESIEEALG